MVGSFRGRDLHLEFFFYLIYLYPETFVCFNQVVDRFAGVQNGGMILSPDLGTYGSQRSLCQVI